MKPRHKIIFIILVILQLFALGVMIARQEILLASPVKVMLKCRPIDPRSLFSGDYVILNYDISRINQKEVVALGSGSFRRGDIIYVALEREPNGKYHGAVAISSNMKLLREKYDVVIKGKVRSNYKVLSVSYGVENYFVPQNEGRVIEKNLKDVSVETAINSKGESAIVRLFIKGREVKFY